MRTITVKGTGNVSARPDYIILAAIYYRTIQRIRKELEEK